MFDVSIIATGSSGNLNIIDGVIAIDAGIPARDAGPHLSAVEHILISHRHKDHLNPPVVRWLMRNRPTVLRFGLHMNASCWDMIAATGQWGGEAVAMRRTDLLDEHTHTSLKTSKGVYTLDTYPLVHDVPIQGFVLTNPEGETLIHATDTMTMEHAPRGQFDCLLVEGNWDEDRRDDAILDALEAEDWDAVARANQNDRHLSVQACAQFITTHSHPGSRAWQLHESDAFGMTLGYAGANEEQMQQAVDDNA